MGGGMSPAAASGSVVSPTARPLSGSVSVPGDKSIGHRALILAAVARGRSRIRGLPDAGDLAATIDAVRSLGASVDPGPEIRVEGRGWEGLREADAPLDCRRSGTTMRLLAGVSAGRPFRTVLTGHRQLLRRPMGRVAAPLRALGAEVLLGDGDVAPIDIRGGGLTGTEVGLPVASAQVKSAALLAGLQARGVTAVTETVPTRDHTERLLAWLGAPVERTGRRTTVRAHQVDGFAIDVPGDLSSAAALLAAAALVPGSDVRVTGVGLNPGRTGFLRTLERMGARVEVRPVGGGPEPAGDVRVVHGPLRPIEIAAAEVVPMIDELPLLAVVATVAEGPTVVRGAAELRVKESDRIEGVVAGLRRLGVEAEALEDGFVIHGPSRLRGGRVDARGDHRLAMAFAVAALAASEPVRVDGMGFAFDSFPGFLDALEAL
jgi:3-phosphoshikimate 1-carboxyvinyltransferase